MAEVRALANDQIPEPTPLPAVESGLQRMERALVNAHKAGDVNAARKLAAAIKKARLDAPSQIPGSDIPRKPVPEPEIEDTIIGAGEAALSTVTGATGGTLGMLGGTLIGLAEQILAGEFGTPEAARAVEERAAKGAGALTYAPRTQTGQEMVETIGEVTSAIPPVLPVIPSMAASTVGAGPQVARTAQRAAAAAKEVGKKVTEGISKDKAPTPGTQAAGGAAGVDLATVRQAKADELPVPIKLTEGQKTRDFEAQRFERETAKNPTVGEPIRERFAQQNRQLQQNLDTFLDATGAEAPDLRSIGMSVDKAIRDRAAKDKLRIRALYKEAEKAGDMQGEVNLSALAEYLNTNRSSRTAAPVMQGLAEELQVQGIGGGKLENGSLKVVPGTLKQAEDIRKSIGRLVNDSNANDLRVATELKGIIDQATEGAGGKAYQVARSARRKFAREYEDVSLVRNIIGKKRGSEDRAIALEDVLNRAVLSPSASTDDVRNIRRLLQTSGENGKQAWKELQGGVIRHIKDEATKSVALDGEGRPVMSPAQLDRVLRALDKSGKLDFIFGKKGAELLRTLNDVAKDVLTVAPGAANTSHTASVILGALDGAIWGATGMPAPVLSGIRLVAKGVKDGRTKARVKKALGD